MSGFVYLLDTNIISDLSRHLCRQGGTTDCRKGRAHRLLQHRGCLRVALWCPGKGFRASYARVEDILSVIEVLAPDADADRLYSEIRTELEASGAPIGPNDLLIAAHALALDLIMVTANTAEFSRILDLPVENWL
ncbi:MAG: PIN domain-containing protein [Desulfurivibrionaceae bacterium]